MNKPRVQILSSSIRPDDEVDRLFREEGFEPVYTPPIGNRKRTEDEMLELLRGFDGAIVPSAPITARVIQAADRLRVLSRTGVGYDGIDVKAATARGIIVANGAGVNRHSVAELVFALMLCCARRLAENFSEIRRGGWERRLGMDLAGKTLGLVGFGTIGKEVAQRADAFEMRILAYDLVQDLPFAEAHRVAFVSLERLLRESDFVSLHIFLNEKNRHLMNAEHLALMKPTAFLINTARGGVVDTAALCRALKEKRMAGAALDVFEEEPLPADSPLRELDNVYLSPHIGGATTDARRNGGIIAAENVIRALRGERPQGIVNPEVLLASSGACDRRRQNLNR
jgi:D-3-phosphoglycerate dehydrogenase